MYSLFYIHGGPGLNSKAEEIYLKNLLAENNYQTYFYNEPSESRGQKLKFEDHFVNYLIDLEDQFLDFVQKNENKLITIVAHSFGVFGLHYLVKKYTDKISRLVVIAPAFYMDDVESNLIKLSIEDYKLIDHDKFLLLSQLDQKREKSFNKETLDAIYLVATNPKYPTYYFSNKEVMAEYYAQLNAEYAFDLGKFISVRESQNEKLVEHKQSQIPMLIIWGENEQFVAKDKEQQRLKDLFPKAVEKIVLNSSHYPHLESKMDFINKLNNFLSITYTERENHVQTSIT